MIVVFYGFFKGIRQLQQPREVLKSEYPLVNIDIAT